MIWPLSTPNNFDVYSQKHNVSVLVFLVRTRGTRCLVLSLTSSTFYDVICLTERHDHFEHSTVQKNHICERCIFMHAYR